MLLIVAMVPKVPANPCCATDAATDPLSTSEKNLEKKLWFDPRLLHAVVANRQHAVACGYAVSAFATAPFGIARSGPLNRPAIDGLYWTINWNSPAAAAAAEKTLIDRCQWGRHEAEIYAEHRLRRAQRFAHDEVNECVWDKVKWIARNWTSAWLFYSSEANNLFPRTRLQAIFEKFVNRASCKRQSSEQVYLT